MLVWNNFLNDARVLKEAETLVGAGYRVTVHALHLPGVTVSCETLESGVRIKRMGMRQAKRQADSNQALAGRSRGALGMAAVSRVGTHLAMLSSLVLSRPDAIHAHDVNVLPTAWLASVLARAPLVYDAHEISTDREGYKAFRGLVGWVEKKLMPKAAGTITTTEARAKFFARAYGVPRPLVLQNRPRLTKAQRSNRIRDELQLEKSWPIVLYQGGLQQGRGLPRLVEAAQFVEAAYFVFIGGGRQEGELHKLTDALGLGDRVRFIPTVALSELPSYTASADIGVQPIENTCLNHFTTDSNKLFEYVVAGLPVVASQLPEISKVVREHDLGLLIPPGDTHALANAIRRLVSEPELRQHYRARAEQAAQTLNWETQEQSLVALYAKVLAPSQAGEPSSR